MKYVATKLLCVLLLLCASAARADLRAYADPLYKGLRFDSVTVKDGLSHQSVTAVLKDDKGFIWIGTQTGLNRFDGHEVRVFRQHRGKPWSLPNEHITVLRQGKGDQIWIGTLGGGLVKLDLPTGRFIPIRFSAERAGAAIIIDVRLDQAGNLWVATEAGLGVLKKGSETIDFVTPATVRVRQLIASGSTGIYALTVDRLLRFTTSTAPAVEITPDHLAAADLQLMAPRRLHAPGADSTPQPAAADGYWAVSGSALYLAHFTDKALTLEPLGQSSVDSPRAIAEDAWGNLWIGGIDGIDTYVSDRHAFIEPASAITGSERSMRSLYTVGNEIWLGTNLEGALYTNLAAQVAINITTPDDNPVVAEYSLDNGLVVVGVHPGVYAFDPSSLNFASMVPDGIDKPSAVSFLPVGNRIWYSATNGLGWFDKNTLAMHVTMRQSFEYPVLIAAAENGNLMLSTGSELVEVSADGKTILDRKALARTATRVDIDKHRQLIGGFYGAQVFEASCRCMQDLLANYPGSRPIVTAIQKGKGDTWWLGTHSQGLIRMSWNGQDVPGQEDFEVIDRNHGLASNAIGAIERGGNGDLWLTTTLGFSRLEPASGVIENFTPSEGAADKGYIIGATTRTSSGEIVFGGLHSITVIPGPPDWQRSAPPPVVTDVKLANKEVVSKAIDEHSPLDLLPPYNQHLVLPYGSPALTFDFSTLLYPATDKLAYSYRLYPLELAWTSAQDENRLLATYTSLEPGAYTFEVSNDPEHRYVTRIPVTVTTPWYLQVWVLGLAVLAFGLLVWLGIQWRLRALAVRAKRLEKEVAARTAELSRTNHELTEALEQVKTLRGIVPICASCKKIRNDEGYWEQLEVYMREHTEAEFSHGICLECAEALYPEEHKAREEDR